MPDSRPGPLSPSSAAGPGIEWEPGEEDYPFRPEAGESALDYVRRWLASAPYARIEQGGARFIHEEDVTNLFNHVTADVELLRIRLGEFGDRVLAAGDHAAAVHRLEEAAAALQAAIETLGPPTER